MKKHIYLVKGEKTEIDQHFKNRIFQILEATLKKNSVHQLKLIITDLKPPSLSVIPFRKDKIAVISVKSEKAELIDEIMTINGFNGIYSVDEALPVAYNKTWPDGEKTPGVCLLTLFKRKKDLEYEKFIDRWHNGHTPLSLKIHPLWNYNRNVVGEELSGSSVWYDGIVEEHFKSSSDLLNPFKFFGNPFIIIPRMLKVYFDVNSFIEYASIKTYLANEYILKS